MLIVNILLGLVGLGIIVLVHELGHFIAAKSCGVKVDTFSIGWGKKLVGIKIGETMYQVAVFPLGGYCKMKGEYFKEDMTEESFQKARSEEGTFLAAAWWKKVIISVGGPLANLVFAFVVFSLIWLVGFRIDSSDTRIIVNPAYLQATQNMDELPSVKAGLQTGDVIESINGAPVQNFNEISRAIEKAQGPSVDLKIKRGGETLDKQVAFRYTPDSGRKYIGIMSWLNPVVDKPEPASLLKPGDTVEAMVGKTLMIGSQQVALPFYARIDSNLDLDIAMDKIPASLPVYYRSVDLVVRRDGRDLTLGVNVNYGKDGRPGLGFSYKANVYRSHDYGFIGSFGEGFYDVTSLLGMTFKGLGDLFSFKVKNLTDVVAGPIRIIPMVGEVTVLGFSLGIGEGITQFFKFLCVLCVLISIMNMLPIPALDGGQVVLSLIMGIRKNNLTMKFLVRYQLIGFSIVILLFLLGIFSDIISIFK
jgi:regulator of sigma E protease